MQDLLPTPLTASTPPPCFSGVRQFRRAAATCSHKVQFGIGTGTVNNTGEIAICVLPFFFLLLFPFPFVVAAVLFFFVLLLLLLLLLFFFFLLSSSSSSTTNRLVGQVVKASGPKAEGPEFESRLRRDFSGSSHTKNWHSSGYPARLLAL